MNVSLSTGHVVRGRTDVQRLGQLSLIALDSVDSGEFVTRDDFFDGIGVRYARTYVNSKDAFKKAMLVLKLPVLGLYDEILAVDTETYNLNGLDISHPEFVLTSRLRCIQVATRENAFLFDLHHLDESHLRELVSFLNGRVLAFHNYAYDVMYLEPLGLSAKRVIDTMLLDRLLHTAEVGKLAKGYRLVDTIARRLLVKLEEKEQHNHDWGRDDVISDADQDYAFTDVELLWHACCDLLRSGTELGLPHRPMFAYSDAQRVCGDIRKLGVPFNLRAAKELLESLLNSSREVLNKMLVAYQAHQFSDKTKGAKFLKFVTDAFGFSDFLVDDSGKASANYVARKYIRHMCPEASEFIDDYNTWSRQCQVISYLKSYITSAEESEKGWLHPSFMIHRAITGRMACNSPNLQSVSKHDKDGFDGGDIRRLFEAPAGYKLISADYEQIELKIAAVFWGERRLLRMFSEGTDIHTATASSVYKVAPDDVSKHQRNVAKALNFGLLYGSGDKRVQQELLKNDVVLDIEEVSSLVAAWRELYAGITEHHVACKKIPRYVSTGMGRMLYIRRDSNKRTYPLTLNFPIQATGADIFVDSVNLVYDELKQRGMQSRIVIMMHDELVVLSPDDEADEAQLIIKQAMETAASEYSHNFGGIFTADCNPPEKHWV